MPTDIDYSDLYSLPSYDEQEEEVEKDLISGDRSFERNKAVKAWYLIKRRRKRLEEEEA